MSSRIATTAGAVRATSVPVAADPSQLPALWAPDSYTPPTGPRFNNPFGSRTARRNNLTHVIRTVNSMPGYRVGPDTAPCPRDRAQWPATIRIALYSMTDSEFADALIAADRRCISVQLLMNNHLNATNSPAWGRLSAALGGNRSARSFTRRCYSTCRGVRGAMHSKFYLFDVNDSLVYPRADGLRDVVMFGSSNMTSFAAGVQWNDLYTVRGNRTLIDQFQSVFTEMVPDVRIASPLRLFTAGAYQSTFWPDPGATQANDRVMAALRSVRCNGASGGTGVNGHSVVYIIMHAWYGTRGLYLANQVRKMYNAGCYVRILYSILGYGTFRALTKGTGSRMVARRTMFSTDGDRYADVLSHMKMLAVSGNVAGNPAAKVVWTGSENWADRGNNGDEVMVRIPFAGAFSRYREHWDFIRQRKSSPVWASYKEPRAGDPARRLEAGIPVAPYVDASRTEHDW